MRVSQDPDVQRRALSHRLRFLSPLWALTALGLALAFPTRGVETLGDVDALGANRACML